MKVILITYTTLYRTGGNRFKEAAETLSIQKREQHKDALLICTATETKLEFLKTIESISNQRNEIIEFHFFGHSGVYGVMFGTTSWPEQFSPYEWKQQSWALAVDAKLYFHACRTARWFSAFLSNHFKRSVYGYWWYTTVSGSAKKFQWSLKKDVYIVSCAGRKSHGLLASIWKYVGLSPLYPMVEFKPEDGAVDRSYDQVSEFYEETFEDLRVRRDEWAWLTSNIDFSSRPKILDVGCGNGAFLRQMAERIDHGAGVDASASMLKMATEKAKQSGLNNLNFSKVSGPQLDFPDNQFDYVISVLSFRYLDWDPMVQEMVRVLKPGGRILVLDMVAAPLKIYEWPILLLSKVRHYWQRFQNPKYYKALSAMVKTPQWQQMLKYNPIRAEHEYRWYLQSRFPGSAYSCINIGWNSRIITFVSEPVHNKSIQKMSFP